MAGEMRRNPSVEAEQPAHTVATSVFSIGTTCDLDFLDEANGKLSLRLSVYTIMIINVNILELVYSNTLYQNIRFTRLHPAYQLVLRVRDQTRNFTHTVLLYCTSLYAIFMFIPIPTCT